MAIYLLDTTTLTHLRHRHPGVYSMYSRHNDPMSGDIVGVASVNVEEVLTGWLGYLQRSRTPQEEQYASQMLNDTVYSLARFALYAMTDAAVIRHVALRKLKLNVGRNDLRLAALAMELGATVVTDNIRDFARVPGLLWVDWTK
jgi:tRNA(fMet)-specific endonuclease VapC